MTDKHQPTSISSKLQQLIEKANFSFPSTGEAVTTAYKQALEEGYTPRQAKNILYDNIHFLNERTIRRYMPNEAKDSEKIRIINRAADNGSQNIKKQDNIDSGTPQNSEILKKQTSLGRIGTNSADMSTVTKKEGYSNLTDAISDLQDFIKQINEYAAKLSDRITDLDHKNQCLKEETKLNKEEKIASGKTHLDIIIPKVYRDILHLKLNNITHGRILIDNGFYSGLEPK